MKKQIHTVEKVFVSFLFLIISMPLLTAQESDYTVRVSQPVGDTIKSCPGKTIILMAEGLNADGKPFDNNQVVYTWDMGYEGQIVTGFNTSFNYPVGGHYVIRLYVTGKNGPAAKNIPEIHVYVGIRPWFTGTRSNQPSICSGSEITLTGFVNPVEWTGDTYGFINKFAASDFKWNGPGIQSDRNGISRIAPPLDQGHVQYVFRVTDDFQCFYDTTLTLYGVYAEYSMNPLTGEAPLEVTFSVDSTSNGGSENSITYDWEFWEVTDTSTLDRKSDPKVTIEMPGQYATRVIARYQQCTYKFASEDYIRVDSSLLEIPNVFTPNEDGANDYFQVKAKSLRSFHGIIYNRWGRAVFEWTDPKTFENGWNGKMNNTGQDCPSGTYYYIIKAEGYDKNKTEPEPYPFIQYEGGVYKGFLTLIR
jgi:gliding motility-associated-like protein